MADRLDLLNVIGQSHLRLILGSVDRDNLSESELITLMELIASNLLVNVLVRSGVPPEYVDYIAASVKATHEAMKKPTAH